MSYVLTILGMAAITALVKAVLFVAGHRIVLPALLKQALDFVPVAVLTAIIVPMVLAPQGAGLELSWRNPRLAGALVAIAVCLVSRHQLMTIVAGMAAFILWRLAVSA